MSSDILSPSFLSDPQGASREIEYWRLSRFREAGSRVKGGSKSFVGLYTAIILAGGPALRFLQGWGG
jgi:hypothetical protein